MIHYLQENEIQAVNELGNTLSPKFTKTINLYEIANDKYTKVLVYTQNEEVKGFLMYTELEETVDILDIVVKEEYRQQHIGSCLFDFMISELQESVKVLTLEVRKNNTVALSFYKKFGFEIMNTRKKYYNDGEDAYLMGRRLEQ